MTTPKLLHNLALTCVFTRSFSSSPLSRASGLGRLKKASDLDTKRNAKGVWNPPPKKKKEEVISYEATLTPEQLERWKAKTPVDDVWFQKYYPEKTHDLDRIVAMHRQANDPTMLDNPCGDVFVDLVLNMASVKQTKPLKSFSVLTEVPHKSEHTTVDPRDVAVLVKNPDLQLQMEALGATFVGAEEMIAKLKAGTIAKDTDFDYLIAHMDIVQDLSPLRKKYSGYVPSEKDGTLGVNIHKMFHLHQTGYLFKLKANPYDPFEGSATLSLGKLSSSIEMMLENLEVYMKILQSHRPPNLTAKRGVFIKGANIRCPPNDEVFKWHFDHLNKFIDSPVESSNETEDEDVKGLLELGVIR